MAAGLPLAARAQQTATPVIGFLSSSSWDNDDARRLPPFRQGLNEAGYVEGQNVAIEYHGAENQIDRLPALAADLVRRRVSLIATGGSPVAALAAKSIANMLRNSSPRHRTLSSPRQTQWSAIYSKRAAHCRSCLSPQSIRSAAAW